MRRLRIACLPCRGKKAKCSGTKPSCEQCHKSNLGCVYPEGRARKRTRADMERDHGTAVPSASSEGRRMAPAPPLARPHIDASSNSTLEVNLSSEERARRLSNENGELRAKLARLSSYGQQQTYQDDSSRDVAATWPISTSDVVTGSQQLDSLPQSTGNGAMFEMFASGEGELCLVCFACRPWLIFLFTKCTKVPPHSITLSGPLPLFSILKVVVSVLPMHHRRSTPTACPAYQTLVRTR